MRSAPVTWIALWSAAGVIALGVCLTTRLRQPAA
jgi:hypothetical protein